MTSEILDELRKKELTKILKLVHGNRTHAAAKLGVSVRTIRTWIKNYGLNKKFPARRGRK